MKSLSAKTFQCGVTVQGLTTLSGTVYLTALTNTATWDYVVVGTTAQGQLYTRTYAQLMSDITSGIGLSGYVPTSRTLTINGVSYDLTANRSWTISTVDYTSRLQHQVKAGVAINKGQAVYVTSADGTNMIVGLASNASEATSSKTMGLLDATVSTNGFANVVTEGLLAGLDTSTAGTEGDPVWLGTGGNLIYGLTNKPYAPAHLVFIGIVTRKNASNGEIFVKVQNGFELNEIHDVDLKTNLPTAGQLLRYDSDGLWKNWSPNYLTAEADTLATVTGRGATTNTSITVGPDLIVQADGSVNYTASRLWLNSHNNYRGAGVHMSGVGSTWFAGTPYTDFDGGYVIARTGTSNDVSSAQYSNALLTVKSSGNVGIGTITPTTKLHVVGTVTATAIQLNTGSGDYYINGSSNTLRIGSLSTTNKIQLELFHSVNPVSLGISYNGGEALPYIESVHPSYDVNTHLLFKPGGTENWRIGSHGSNHIYGSAFVIKPASNNYDFYLANSSGTALFYSDTSTGSIGIGTTSPASRLQIGSVGSTGYSVGNGLAFGDGTRAGALNVDSSGTTLYSSTNLIFSPGTTEAVRITAAGNVGIGTTSPQYKLDVNGSFNALTSGVYLTYNSGIIYHGSSYYQFSSGSYYHLYGRTGMGLIFGSNNAEVGRFDLSGNLGIGTTDPQRKLDSYTVGGAFTGNNYVRFGVGAAGAYGGNNHLEFSYNDYGNLGGRAFDNIVAKIQANAEVVSATDVGGTLIFSTKATGGTYLTAPLERMRITSGGNIGVGTASPTTILDIQPSSGTPVFRIARTGGTDVRIGASVTATGGLIGTYTASPFSIYTNSSAKVTITSDGSVGIGTTSPNSSARLHLSGATTSPSLNTTNPANITAVFSNSDPQYGTMFATDPTGKGLIQQRRTDSATYYDLLLQPYGGNIGIGITSPIAKLDVLGTIRSELGSDGNFIILQATGQRVHYIKRSAQILQFTSDGANTYDVRFDSSNASVYILTGSVGIGTTSPATKLDVSGVITATGGNSTNWNTAYGWGNHSSAGYVPQTRTLSINGTSYDLSANRSWTIPTDLQSAANGSKISSPVNIGSTIVVNVATATYDGATFNYVLKDGTNFRAGTVIAVWNGVTAQFNETTTNDIGNTTPVTLSVTVSGGNAQLVATSASAGWTIKVVTIGI